MVYKLQAARHDYTSREFNVFERITISSVGFL